MDDSRKHCSLCGALLDLYSIKCSKCGSWTDNSVFTKLDSEEIEKIKKEDLIIVTPSLICLMFESIVKGEFDNLTKARSKDLINIMLFTVYCYSCGIRMFAIFKKGKRILLVEESENAFIRQFMFLLEKIAKGETFKPGFPIRAIKILRDLDAVLDKYRSNEINSHASEFLLAQEWGKLIYNQNNINNNMELLVNHTLIIEHFTKIFSKLFIVEEGDFDWKAIINYR
jgi:hypothetical protein